MPPVRTGQLAALLQPNIYRVYVETGRERPHEFPYWVNTLDLPWQGFTNQQISGLGTVPEMAEGNTFTYDAPILGATKTHNAISYGLGFEVTYLMWHRELYGIMDMMSRELRRSMDYRLEVAAHNVLNNAFVTTNYTTFDGAALISTAHTTLDGRTVSNRPAVEIQPGLTAFQNMIIHFHNLTNERNIPELRGPRHILIQPNFLFTVRETLGSTHKPFSANNEINSIVQEELTFMVSHYFTVNSGNGWVAMAAKGDHDLNYYTEVKPMFDYFDDPRTLNAVYTTFASMEPSRADEWRGVYGSTG